ncbi:MAG: hypothetical protein LLG01_16965 [Planctomycetaceae bacterium]|nr:hypothetical protein [Planctomycetaceae bacterium]
MKKTNLLLCFAAVAVCAFLLAAATAGPAGAQDDKKPHKTDWMHKGKFGVMFHYSQALFGKFGSEEKWDKAVNNFDVKGLADQLEGLGAGWFQITTRHMGLQLAPTKAFRDGKYPTRDLIMDLGDELPKHGVRLMLYYPTGMGINPPESYKSAAATVEELSKRYGTRVSGWWFDNNTGIAEAQKLIAAAARSGNPDAIIGFSPGHGPRRNTPYDDFTAGNQHVPSVGMCGGRWVSGAQWHILTHMAHNWGGACKQREASRFSPEAAVQLTKSITDKGGVVTWDVAFDKDNGHIADPCMVPLKAIAKALGTAKKE